MTTFTIPGKPFAWRRARSNGKFRFKDDATEAHEAVLQAIALQHFKTPMTGPVKLTVRCTFAIPASWSKKKREAAMGSFHTQKPDADNVAKALKDGLNRVAWVDDSQVADMRCVKRWGSHAETFVEVGALSNG